MQKECDYCGHEFDAQRSDAKYCSGTCKNNAYLARKANPEISNASSNGGINGNNISNRRINVQPSVPLTPAAINKMIQGLGSNADILSSLLLEKDTTGEAKASISEYRITLLFTERDLKYEKDKNEELQKTISRLEDENLRLTEKIETNEGSFTDKALAFCEANPNILMSLIDKLDKLGFKAPNAINNTPDDQNSPGQ